MPPAPCAPRWAAGANDCSATAINSHDHFLNILQGTRPPVARRPYAAAIQGRRVIRIQLGITFSYSLGGVVSTESHRAPRLTQAVFARFVQRFPGAASTSCTVAFNRQAPLHTDKNNIGAYYLTCLGRFAGGALCLSGKRRARARAQSPPAAYDRSPVASLRWLLSRRAVLCVSLHA